MNILLVGSGGREHCMAWKMKQSPLCEKLFMAPGNAGSAECGENVSLSLSPPFNAVIDFVKANAIELVAVGPEQPLVEGLADVLLAEGVKVFGPPKAAAMLEGSKDFAKEVMTGAGVPTGAYQTFDDAEKAIAYLDELPAPYVLKFDGLAAGKGVSIHSTKEDAEARIREILEQRIFGDGSLLVEEFFKRPGSVGAGVCRWRKYHRDGSRPGPQANRRRRHRAEYRRHGSLFADAGG